MKQALAGLLKAIAKIAGFVFLLARITDMGVIVMFIAAPAAVIGAVASSHLSDDEDDSNSGYGCQPDSLIVFVERPHCAAAPGTIN
jgi:hypothetical protein